MIEQDLSNHSKKYFFLILNLFDFLYVFFTLSDCVCRNDFIIHCFFDVREVVGVCLDAFGDYGAPEELKGIDFLNKLRTCMNQQSWLVGNLWTVTGDFEEKRGLWKSTFQQVLEARANRKGNMILYGSKLTKLPEKKTFEATAKKLQKLHGIKLNI